ncbi:DMT family transporter [Palleronia sp. LCG004]|uniref:DMT family transporter n=1 Tax=Palleronia sp. LCG004 TaxID=3079304 RepID=UPI00294262FC|nr:DMT family transporter [Palleronia sp. LCG004]WOI55456.1 DMT family transporter [Palleronia sp. LCG004]
MPQNSTFGLSLALAAVLLLSPDTLLMRVSGLDGFEMMAWRGGLVSIVMLSLWLVTSRDRSGDLAAFASGPGLVATLCQAANAILFATGIAVAPVAVVLFALATVPIWAAILGALFLGDRIGRATAVTCIAVLAGIGLSVLAGGHGDGGVNPVLGAFCGLLTAIALAGAFTSYRAAPRLPIMLSLGVGAGLGGTLGLVVSGGGEADGLALTAIATTGAIILPAAFFMLGSASRYTSGANVSLFMLLETVLGPIIVWIALGEAVPPLSLLGGAIVVVSLALYLSHQRRALRRSSS